MTIETPGAVAAPEPKPTPAADKTRSYIVLRSLEPDTLAWYVVGNFDASSTDDAIRKAAAKEAADEEIDTAGTLRYVGVPSRSFQPVELTAKVEPKIEFKR